MNTDGFSKKVMEFEIQNSSHIQIHSKALGGVLAILFSFFLLKKTLRIVCYSGPTKPGSVPVSKL